MKTITKELQVSTELKFSEILTPEALNFISYLHEECNGERLSLLQKRKRKMELYSRGYRPDFPAETREIRERDWKVNEIPEDLQDRRVEITGPVDRKMIINGLNSGAKVFMADFEDASSPTWENMMNGQLNLLLANKNSIDFVNKNGKEYRLSKNNTVLKVRPRGLHLDEKHIQSNGCAISASLVDFGLYFFHNIHLLQEKGSSTYFYLPKIEYYEEAIWWNRVFQKAESYVGVSSGSIKCTVLVETITASFALDEIIFYLRDHIVGLNCGRWDYIFSYIKKMKDTPDFFVPNRDQITMDSPFMAAYTRRVVAICHKRGIHAIGGMAAQIPIKNDDVANATAFDKVLNDKEREVKNGHDGTWVAHPGLVELAKEVFDKHMPTPNQIDRPGIILHSSASALLEVPKGWVDEAGIRKNINVGILYIESWLMGNGAAALYHLMEDAATAEISRTQIWLWLKQKIVTKERKLCEAKWIDQLIEEEMQAILTYVGSERFENGKFTIAKKVFRELIFNDELDEFLTVKAYNYLT